MIRRIFSLVTAINTTPRKGERHNSLMRLQGSGTTFTIHGKWCRDFVPSQSMIDGQAKWKETTTPTPLMATAASSIPKQSGQCEIETGELIQALLVMLDE
ncbi:hypothetical protein PoB_001485500 [Plakobranchus ocellatus]|uniref:Uncharacterized protein n=1 Tax=Plakobranchus ocellatus TaxID=259542 RepID=A0AAV3YZH2_9GAST|nr:hypothetical protein PoB_001485500 [Plakobranchus ocellatus]